MLDGQAFRDQCHTFQFIFYASEEYWKQEALFHSGVIS